MPSELFYLNSVDSPIAYTEDVLLVVIPTVFVEISVFDTESVDPDQKPRSAASGLCLRKLQMCHLLDTRHIKRRWACWSSDFTIIKQPYM